MKEGIENIGKKDVIWSYASTLFLAGAGVILLPFILHYLSDETVGVWQIFQAITTLVLLLDFGFRPSFARNISYILSGVKHLQRVGVENVDDTQTDIDYSLLKGTLHAMRIFYRWLALGALLVLGVGGSVYLHFEVMSKYSGNHTDAWIAWAMLILINCYNLYTLYYDSLLLGKGYVKRSQQITIIGQSVYLLVAILLIYLGCGLTAIVSAQLLSILIRRLLSHKVFFTKEMKSQLSAIEPQSSRQILNAIFPNALKVGLTLLGGFCVNQSAILIGAHYLTLADTGAYGVTYRVITLISGIGLVIYQTCVPKLAHERVNNNLKELKRLYRLSIVSLLIVMVVLGVALMFGGNWAMRLIHSQTLFLPRDMIMVMLLIQFLEQNHSIAAGFIMADNKVPFCIPSLLSGAATIVLLYLMLGPLNMGIWGMILAPGIAQLAYQNWKWPSVVIKELRG